MTTEQILNPTELFRSASFFLFPGPLEEYESNIKTTDRDFTEYKEERIAKGSASQHYASTLEKFV